MNLPTLLTISRLIITPLFLITYLYYPSFGISYKTLPFILLFLMTFSEVTDAFDGYLARKFNQVTDLGKILDPMADSVSRITVFLGFTQGPVQIPIFFVFLILYRDSVVSTLRTICALKGFALAARKSGKLKAIIQAVVGYLILLAMIPHSQGMLSTKVLQSISFWSVGFASLYTLFSSIDYMVANKKYIQQIFNDH